MGAYMGATNTRFEEPKKPNQSHLPPVYIIRPHASGAFKHWAVLYVDVKFELQFTPQNRKCMVKATRLTDANRVNRLNKKYTCTCHGNSDESLSAAFEHAKRLLRGNDEYALFSNDCQLFAVRLVKFLSKENLSRSGVNVKGSSNSTGGTSNMCVGGYTFHLMQQNVKKYDRMMNDNGFDRQDFYEKKNIYSFANPKANGHGNRHNNDHKSDDNDGELVLNDKFMLQLTYCAAFAVNKSSFKYRLGLDAGGFSALFLLTDIVVCYIIQKFQDKKRVSTDLFDFIDSASTLPHLMQIAKDTNYPWFTVESATELCEKIASMIEFNDMMVRDINSVLKVEAETDEDGKILSLWGNDCDVLYAMDIRFQASVQVCYWKTVIMADGVGTIKKINLKSAAEIEYILCCLQLKMYSNHAATVRESNK